MNAPTKLLRTTPSASATTVVGIAASRVAAVQLAERVRLRSRPSRRRRSRAASNFSPSPWHESQFDEENSTTSHAASARGKSARSSCWGTGYDVARRRLRRLALQPPRDAAHDEQHHDHDPEANHHDLLRSVSRGTSRSGTAALVDTPAGPSIVRPTNTGWSAVITRVPLRVRRFVTRNELDRVRADRELGLAGGTDRAVDLVGRQQRRGHRVRPGVEHGEGRVGVDVG